MHFQRVTVNIKNWTTSLLDQINLPHYILVCKLQLWTKVLGTLM